MSEWGRTLPAPIARQSSSYRRITPMPSSASNRRLTLRAQLAAAAALALVLFGAIPLDPPALAATATEMPADLSARVALLLPSVVAIKTKANAAQGSTTFEGSGFIVDPAGLIITNRHVIQGAFEIVATLPGRLPMPAKAVFVSERLDLAFLKVDAGQPLPPVKLGDSATVKIGDPVLLIGNALGLRTAVSAGIISAVNCDLGDTMYDHYFQTDGALNHGNSGGPMFNLRGEVIAIDTGLISSPGNSGSVGVGFSMPINDAKFVYDQYAKTGHVSAGFVGVRGQRVTDELAEAFGLKSASGAIVTQVDPHGPAAGKILDGDIVLQVNDQDASDMPAVARLVAMASNGEAINVRLLRGGKEETVVINVKQMTSDEKAAMMALGHAPAGSMPFATPSKPGMKL